MLAKAKAVMAEANEYSQSKHDESDQLRRSIIEEARRKADSETRTIRDAAQREIDRLKRQISSLQDVESTLMSRVSDIRTVLLNSFDIIDEKTLKNVPKRPTVTADGEWAQRTMDDVLGAQNLHDVTDDRTADGAGRSDQSVEAGSRS